MSDIGASRLATWWAAAITRGQAPAPYSPRDGRSLTKVASCERLSQQDLKETLHSAIRRHSWLGHVLQRALGTCSSHFWRSPEGKCLLALARAAAYAEHGNVLQCAKDARAALAYCTPARSHTCSSARRDDSSSKEIGCSGCGGHPAGLEPGILVAAAAHHYLAAALHGQEEWVTAACHMHQAHELVPGEPHFQQEAARMTAAVPDEAAREAATLAGSDGLRTWMREMDEQQMPEFMRPRPKYHYYNQWMRERIEAMSPGLPEAVVQKLLGMDAGDLHFMCQHPVALIAQAEEYHSIYHEYGDQYLLEDYEPDPLSWDEVKALTGNDAVGLPIGYDAASQEPGMLELLQEEAVKATEVVHRLIKTDLGGAGIQRKHLVLTGTAQLLLGLPPANAKAQLLGGAALSDLPGEGVVNISIPEH